MYGQVSHLAGGEAEELEVLARGGSANAPFSTLSLSLATSHTPRHPTPLLTPSPVTISSHRINQMVSPFYEQVSHLAGGEAEELEVLARGGSANAPDHRPGVEQSVADATTVGL